MNTLTHTNTFPCSPHSLSVSHVGSCISSEASDCCHGVKHPCNPSGFNQPLCLRCKAPRKPASCFPQVLSADSRYRRQQRNKHRQASSYLTEYGSDIRAMVHILSNTYMLAFTGFAVSCVTSRLATTPGVIIVTP